MGEMKHTLENLPGVVSVTEVGKQEALARFKERLGQQEKLLHSLGTDNPFPNSFEVQVDGQIESMSWRRRYTKWKALKRLSLGKK